MNQIQTSAQAAFDLTDRQLALIGYPVKDSQSPIYHQYFLQQMNREEQYGKCEVQKNDLAHFLASVKQQGAIRGLSVTMPLKEAILPYLDQVDLLAADIGAVNTVQFKAGKAIGFNTDAIGALRAIEQATDMNLHGQKALIVGAGGAALAIGYVLKQAGMQVIIANRTLSKAEMLAQKLNAQVCAFDSLAERLNDNMFILINATAVGMQDASQIIAPALIPRSTMVMDVVSAPKNQFLHDLTNQGNRTVSGREMWIHQAIEQYRLWFDGQLDLTNAYTILAQAVAAHNH